MRAYLIERPGREIALLRALLADDAGLFGAAVLALVAAGQPDPIPEA